MSIVEVPDLSQIFQHEARSVTVYCRGSSTVIETPFIDVELPSLSFLISGDLFPVDSFESVVPLLSMRNPGAEGDGVVIEELLSMRTTDAMVGLFEGFS